MADKERKWTCLGCGAVTASANEPMNCPRCGDNEYDSGLPVFEGGRTEPNPEHDGTVVYEVVPKRRGRR